MEVATMEFGLKIKLKDKELTAGMMAENIQEFGKIIICMVLGNICGKMAENMKVIMKMIKKMVSEYIHGQMAESMKAIGFKANNTEKENIFNKTEVLNSVFGNMVVEKNG